MSECHKERIQQHCAYIQEKARFISDRVDLIERDLGDVCCDLMLVEIILSQTSCDLSYVEEEGAELEC